MPRNTMHKPRMKKQDIHKGDGITNLTSCKQKYVNNSIVTEIGTDDTPGTIVYNIGDFGCMIKVTLDDKALDVKGHYISNKDYLVGSSYRYNHLLSMKEIRQIIVELKTANDYLTKIINDDIQFKCFILDALKRQKGDISTEYLTRKYCYPYSEQHIKVDEHNKEYADYDSCDILDNNEIAGNRTRMNTVIELIDYLSADRLNLCTAKMGHSGAIDCTTKKAQDSHLFNIILEQRELLYDVKSSNDNRRKFNYETCEFKALDKDSNHIHIGGNTNEVKFDNISN